MRTFVVDVTETILSPKILVIWVGGSLVLTLTGPFGTFTGLSLGDRAAYWSIVFGLSLVIGIGTRSAVDQGLREQGGVVRTLVASVVFTALFTPLLAGLTALVAKGPISDVMPVWQMVLIVFAVPVSFHILKAAILETQRSEEGGGAGGPGTPRLLQRLEDDARGPIRRVQVRDHYVDVFTEAGQTSLLMRFTDALAELEGAAGLRVHRSHWVALEAVEAVERDGGRVFVRLECGSRIPVSRNYRKDVEAAVAAR